MKKIDFDNYTSEEFKKDYKTFQDNFKKVYGGNETMRVSDTGRLYRLTLRQHKYEMHIYKNENIFIKILRSLGFIKRIDIRLFKIPKDFDS